MRPHHHSPVKLTIMDEQRNRLLDVLELSIEEAGQLIGRTSLHWCLSNLGQTSPVAYDCFHKVIVSYKLEEIQSFVLKEVSHA